MKKYLCLFLVFVHLCTLAGCSQKEYISEKGLYAYTKSATAYDEYARENYLSHLAYYGSLSGQYVLGKGIFLYQDKSNIPMVYYPVWKNERIAGMLVVFAAESQYSASYWEMNDPALNNAIDNTSKDNPLKLFRIEKNLYASYGGRIYELFSEEIKDVTSLSLKIQMFHLGLYGSDKCVNVREPLIE